MEICCNLIRGIPQVIECDYSIKYENNCLYLGPATIYHIKQKFTLDETEIEIPVDLPDKLFIYLVLNKDNQLEIIVDEVNNDDLGFIFDNSKYTLITELCFATKQQLIDKKITFNKVVINENS